MNWLSFTLSGFVVGALALGAGCTSSDTPAATASSTAGGGGATAGSSTSASTSAAAGGGGGDVSSSGDTQTPPSTNGTDVEAWLAKGDYKAWSCEAAVHAARSPSPHGFNRICSNSAISTNAAGTANWPKGAAAVKELYTAATDATPVGYAVYLKKDADSAAGANWYWYERTATSVVADGLGSGGTPLSICVGCHAAAGSDAAHTPSTGGRDEVYTPVP